MIATESLLTIACTATGGIVTIGAVYGRFHTRITEMQKQIDALNVNHATIIEVKTKIDFIIDHFLKQNEK